LNKQTKTERNTKKTYDGLTDRRLFTAESFVVERIVGTDTLSLVADAISSNTDAIVETRTVEAAPGD